LPATIYHALGIPLNEPQNNTGINRPLTTGKPILDLFGGVNRCSRSRETSDLERPLRAV
jgi:hypothetical protein